MLFLWGTIAYNNMLFIEIWHLKCWLKLCLETGLTKGKGRGRLRPTLPLRRTEPVLLILSWPKPAFSQWREAERVWAFCFSYFHSFQWWGRLHRDETFMTMWKYIKLLQLNWMWDLTCMYWETSAHPHSVSSRYDMWRWVLYKSKQNFVCTLMHSDLPASCNRMTKALKSISWNWITISTISLIWQNCLIYLVYVSNYLGNPKEKTSAYQ